MSKRNRQENGLECPRCKAMSEPSDRNCRECGVVFSWPRKISTDQTQHTPGPWQKNAKTAAVNSASGLHICDVNSYGATHATRDANARLIAAAPELLAALKAIMRELPKPFFVFTPEEESAFALAEAAVAKATTAP